MESIFIFAPFSPIDKWKLEASNHTCSAKNLELPLFLFFFFNTLKFANEKQIFRLYLYLLNICSDLLKTRICTLRRPILTLAKKIFSPSDSLSSHPFFGNETGKKNPPPPIPLRQFLAEILRERAVKVTLLVVGDHVHVFFLREGRGSFSELFVNNLLWCSRVTSKKKNKRKDSFFVMRWNTLNMYAHRYNWPNMYIPIIYNIWMYRKKLRKRKQLKASEQVYPLYFICINIFYSKMCMC